MEAETAYKELHDRVRDLQFRVKDALDEPDDPMAQQLQKEVQRLEDEVQMHKHPRTIEERIKIILEVLEPARNGRHAYMSVSDAVEFCETFEDVRRDVREHPDY